MARNPCPASVKTTGGHLVHTAEYLEQAVPLIYECLRHLDQTETDMIALGAKKMEYAEGRGLLYEALAGIMKVRQAHNSFRKGLGNNSVDEPSDADIKRALVEIRSGSTITPMGGGGGNR